MYMLRMRKSKTAISGTSVDVGLTAVKGKEPFSEKLGFACGSSGMKRKLDIEK